MATAHFVENLTDVTQPNDTVLATSGNSPRGEDVAKAIDNQTGTKYFNFDKLNTGFTVTPSVGPTVVTGLGLTSGNDCPERDPATFRLEGSSDGSNFSLIAEGPVPAFSGRLLQQNILFTNTAAFRVYRLAFPTVANATTALGMQIAEVQLFGEVAQFYAISAAVDSAGSGSIQFNPDSPDRRYAKGTALTLTAWPTNGYAFDKWTEGGVQIATSSNFSFSVSATRQLVAHFIQIPLKYHLAVLAEPTDGGKLTISPNVPKGGYTAGTQVTLTATPGREYEFTRWGGDASSTNATIQVIMTGNLSVTAYFVYSPVTPYLSGLRRQVYTNIAGASVADLTGNTKFPHAPDLVDAVSLLESQYLPDGAGEQYGQRLTGWLVPPLTGTYVFYLAADDAAQVFISTDDSPYNKQLIVAEPTWDSYRCWARTSSEISLVASNYYYIEVVHKEDTGDDNVAVAWQLPGGSAPTNGAAPIGGSNLVYMTEMPEMLWSIDPPGSGTVSLYPPPPTGGRYTNGTEVTFTAVSANGYRFTNWSGALSGVTNPAKLVVSGHSPGHSALRPDPHGRHPANRPNRAHLRQQSRRRRRCQGDRQSDRHKILQL